MEVGWGAPGGPSSSCRPPTLVTLLSPCMSALYFLGGERTSLRSSTSLEQRRSASATAHCSTSGSGSQTQQRISPFWNKSYQERRRLGKCNFASEGSSLGQGSVAVQDSVLEVMEWRSRSSQQLQDPLEEDIESQNYSFDSGQVELESEGYETPSGLGREGTPLEKDGEEGQREVGTQRGGWRGLASGEGARQVGQSRAFLVKKPWRKSESRRQRFKSESSPPREEKKRVPINRDASLEALFKSLASRRTSERSRASERFFGREQNVNERTEGGEVAADRTTATEDGFSSGGNTLQGTEANRPDRTEGRLTINLDLDLYRVSCLRKEGRLDEAEAILKECIRDWQDDGRAYLALGLLALPLKNDQVNLVNGNMTGELNVKNVSGLNNGGLFPGDFLTYEDAVEEADSGRGSVVPRNPAVSEGGDRLKINLDLQMYHAKCLKQKGRVDVSETILRKCIRDWPDDGRPYVALGKLLVQQDRIQDARAVYDSGCQACRGENPYIWQTWAVLEEKCGDVSRARKLFDAATVADKKHVSAWHGWANLELRAGNVKRARSLLNKGLKYCGSNEYIFQTLALLEFRDGKIEEARSLLSKATRYNPKSAASWLAWALMESDSNFPDTARRLFQKGVEASPKNRYVWQAWARFEARKGKEERARELFQRGRELNPKDVVLLQAFALFEYGCGRPGIARDLFRRALSCDTRHQPVWIAWGWMEWKESNLSVARELYQGAIQVDSRSMDAARAFQAWGVLEDRDGDTGLARELFKCALKIDSQNVPTWMAWIAMEDREGRPTRADEIRNLFLQQRTEVVEGPWDVDFSDFLAPAIDRIKGVFKWGRRTSSVPSNETDPSQRGGNEREKAPDGDRRGSSLDFLSDDLEFDVDSFLRRKFPWKYGFPEEGKPSSSNLVQKPTRNYRF